MPDREQHTVGTDEETPARDRRGRQLAYIQIVARDHTRLTARGQDDRFPALAQEIDLAVGGHWRSAENAAQPLLPDTLPGPGVRHGQDPDVADHVDEAVIVYKRGDVGRSGPDSPHHMAVGDVTAPAWPERHERPAPVTAARVDHPVMYDRHRYRKPVVFGDTPEQSSGRGVMAADALARVDDDLCRFPRLDDERCAVGDDAPPAIDFPPDLPGNGIQPEQIRRPLVIAKKDQRVAVDDGRAAVSPVDGERRVLLTQVTFPNQFAAGVERDELTGSEPGINPFTIGNRTGGGQVVLLVKRLQRPLGHELILPDLSAGVAVDRRDEEGQPSGGI